MAKYLKQNQIKSGITIFTVHPKFKWVEVKLVLSRPKCEDKKAQFGWKIVKYKHQPLGNFNINNDGSTVYTPQSFYQDLAGKTEREIRDGYCGDDGIPNKDGVFEYKQDRRAFPTLQKALDYWKSQQTPENLSKWRREDEENEYVFGDVW